VALGSGTRVTVARLSDERGADMWSRDLHWPARRLELSRTGRFLLAESRTGDALEVWDLEHDRVAARFGAADARRSTVTGAFLPDADVVVVSPSQYELEAYALQDTTRLFAGDTRQPRAFAFERIVPASDGDTLAAVGHYFAEMRDSLLILSITRLTSDPDAAGAATVARKPFHDYADRLAVGPCGPDELVVFRDPGDSEEPEEDEDEVDDSDLFGYRGLYIRSLSHGGIVERIPYDGPLDSGDPLFATPRLIAVGSRDGLDLVKRGTRTPDVERIPAVAIALDPVQSRVAYIERSGMLQIITL
jgi:hypothetical protein